MEQTEYDQMFRQVSERRWKLDLLLRVYSLMGLLMAILAGGYFVLTLFPFKLSNQQQVALTVAGVGIALAVLSRTLIILRKQRQFEELDQLKRYEGVSWFLDAWDRFERTSKETLAKEGENFNRHSLRSVIARLYEDGRIDKGDMIKLDEALKMRNAIVHGETRLPPEAAKEIVDSLVEIIQKVRRTRASPAGTE